MVGESLHLSELLRLACKVDTVREDYVSRWVQGPWPGPRMAEAPSASWKD